MSEDGETVTYIVYFITGFDSYSKKEKKNVIVSLLWYQNKERRHSTRFVSKMDRKLVTEC